MRGETASGASTLRFAVVRGPSQAAAAEARNTSETRLSQRRLITILRASAWTTSRSGSDPKSAFSAWLTGGWRASCGPRATKSCNMLRAWAIGCGAEGSEIEKRCASMQSNVPSGKVCYTVRGERDDVTRGRGEAEKGNALRNLPGDGAPHVARDSRRVQGR